MRWDEIVVRVLQQYKDKTDEKTHSSLNYSSHEALRAKHGGNVTCWRRYSKSHQHCGDSLSSWQHERLFNVMKIHPIVVEMFQADRRSELLLTAHKALLPVQERTPASVRPRPWPWPGGGRGWSWPAGTDGEPRPPSRRSSRWPLTVQDLHVEYLRAISWVLLSFIEMYKYTCYHQVIIFTDTGFNLMLMIWR